MICDRLLSLYVQLTLKDLSTCSGDDKIKIQNCTVSVYRASKANEMYSHTYYLTQYVQVIPLWKDETEISKNIFITESLLPNV